MNIAFKLCRPIYDSSLMGVQMIVFSRSSRQVAKGNVDKLGDIYDYAISAVLLLVTPIAVGIALNADVLINVLFLRGQFTGAMAELTVLALLGAVGVVIFQGPVKLLSHSFYAMHRISIPMVAMPLGTVVFFFATKHLSENHGIFGLTLAQSLVAGLTTIAMIFILSYLLPTFSALVVLKRLVLYFVTALFFGFAGLELAEFAGLRELAGLLVSFSVLFVGFAGLLSITREAVWLRALRSIRTAFGQRSS
jgi:peptidoglycan biosynthesis protein MviN/MurJ (putative lipid II flippase)